VNPWNSITSHPWSGKMVWSLPSFSEIIHIPQPKYTKPKMPLKMAETFMTGEGGWDCDWAAIFLETDLQMKIDKTINKSRMSTEMIKMWWLHEYGLIKLEMHFFAALHELSESSQKTVQGPSFILFLVNLLDLQTRKKGHWFKLWYF
jgi:hypothetical protein